jgi:2-polyprenyl-6-methoxyphenol hydroxylase-like FAD-dependent oxidoreductase
MSATTKDRHVVLGSGPAGTALATELARRGHEVRPLKVVILDTARPF